MYIFIHIYVKIYYTYILIIGLYTYCLNKNIIAISQCTLNSGYFIMFNK